MYDTVILTNDSIIENKHVFQYDDIKSIEMSG